MLKEGSSVAEIAGKIGVHRDTIYKELQRSGAGSTGGADSDGFMDIPDDIEEDLPFV